MAAWDGGGGEWGVTGYRVCSRVGSGEKGLELDSDGGSITSQRYERPLNCALENV